MIIFNGLHKNQHSRLKSLINENLGIKENNSCEGNIHKKEMEIMIELNGTLF